MAQSGVQYKAKLLLLMLYFQIWYDPRWARISVDITVEYSSHEDYRYSIGDNYALILENATLSDEGTYTCSAEKNSTHIRCQVVSLTVAGKS